MKVGDWIETPRFCGVRIKEVFDHEEDARNSGYTEPTFYEDPEHGIIGKSLDMYHMEFAAFRKHSPV